MSVEEAIKDFNWTPIIQGMVTGIVTLVGLFMYVAKVKDELCNHISELNIELAKKAADMKASLEAHIKIAEFYMKRFDNSQDSKANQ